MTKELRKIIVSPEINGPEPFVGYGGFCGWPRICSLQNGDLYVAFSAGYAHASWVHPRKNMPPEYEDYMRRAFKDGDGWNAPTGGHIMWTRSSDEGATWTRPRDLCVLPDAYAPGDIMQCSDGTMFAPALIQKSHFWATRVPAPTDPVEFLRYMDAHFPEEIAVFRSEDNGESWLEVGRTSGPFLTRLEAPNSIVESPDGSLLMHLNGYSMPTGKGWPWGEKYREAMALVHSTDRGKTWETWSIFGDPEREMYEGHLARLPDGRLGTTSAPCSLWTTSEDNGRTWSSPEPLFDFLQTDPPGSIKKGDLVVTPDDTVVLVTCGSGGRGQVIYSRDSGRTWTKLAPDRGYQVDKYAYYPSACVMADGSIFMVGDHQDFPNPYGPTGSETLATRFRIRSAEEGEGVEILPIGGELHEVSLGPKDAADQADRRIEQSGMVQTRVRRKR